MPFPASLTLFCRVVDNYGDIGVCWRLARQFAREHGIAVTLWVDDLASFRRICAQVDPRAATQRVDGVVVRHWPEDFAALGPQDVPDAVIEAFACHLPDPFVAAMVARPRAPAWLNLDYLSAEAWVEGCHKMVSPHPSSALRKYFFFPGFTARTGGLLAERDLPARRDAFQSDAGARAAFLAGLGVDAAPGQRLVSLFCYPGAPVADLLRRWRDAAAPLLCLVPEGVAADAVGAFLGAPASPGARATRSALTVQVLPFVDQPDYDRLLWCCDLNFVRGEDSFVRAQWAARPFVWHIYPQEEGAHLVKLDAFLSHYLAALPDAAAAALRAAGAAWNRDGGDAAALTACCEGDFLAAWRAHGADWARELAKNGGLAANLVEFIREIG